MEHGLLLPVARGFDPPLEFPGRLIACSLRRGPPDGTAVPPGHNAELGGWFPAPCRCRWARRIPRTSDGRASGEESPRGPDLQCADARVATGTLATPGEQAARMIGVDGDRDRLRRGLPLRTGLLRLRLREIVPGTLRALVCDGRADCRLRSGLDHAIGADRVVVADGRRSTGVGRTRAALPRGSPGGPIDRSDGRVTEANAIGGG